ncbi:hypothetical protein JTB14_008735 [Gonioctena quinquepunctata]|nr:hypothetical protein JTB14_008735 [Gonioctena quinquepunctata]
MIEAYENTFKGSPPDIVKGLARKREKHNTPCRNRKRLYPKEASTSPNNPYYGSACRKPDTSEKETKGLIQDRVQIMNCTIEDQKRIEVTTQVQSDNPKWYEERKYRLSASRFGEIWKRRLNPGKLVESSLYKIPPNLKQFENGNINEPVVITEYCQKIGKPVSSCEFYVCVDDGFGFLDATPDGLVENDKIIEVKCSHLAKDYSPLEAAKHLNNFYCTLNEDGRSMTLKRNHNYYYQLANGGRSHVIRSTIITHVLEELGITKKQDISAELQPHNIKKSFQQLDRFINSFDQYVNSFSLDLSPDQLFNIASGKAASSQVTEFVLSIEKIGEELRTTFISECASDPKRFEKAIKKTPIHNFSSLLVKKKSVKIGESDSIDDEDESSDDEHDSDDE